MKYLSGVQWHVAIIKYLFLLTCGLDAKFMRFVAGMNSNKTVYKFCMLLHASPFTPLCLNALSRSGKCWSIPNTSIRDSITLAANSKQPQVYYIPIFISKKKTTKNKKNKKNIKPDYFSKT